MIVYYDEVGAIRAATSDEQPIRKTVLSVLQVAGMPDPVQHYVVGGVVVARPAIPAPSALINIGDLLVLSAVPAGTSVEINDMFVGATEAAEDLELDLPQGHWRIDLSPPWPWMDAQFRVTVA